MKKLSDIIFLIRFKLMPNKFKEGSWLVMNGDFTNIGDMWRKSTKKGVWFIPRIEYHKNNFKDAVKKGIKEMKHKEKNYNEPKYAGWYCPKCNFVCYNASQKDIDEHLKEHKEKKIKKCKTCLGYGLWAIGEPSPMGKMDSHSMPSKKCPECGKGGNV